jgi:DNA-binding transcriptional LysR family regulator
MATGRGSKGGRRATPPRRTRPAPKPPAARRAAPEAPPVSGPFRLGAVAGTTPGKWIGIWRERMPDVPLELVPLSAAGQREAVATAAVDAALVRLPIDRDGLHVIPLYDEVPVVVCATESHLAAADELSIADLSGEVLIVPEDAVLDIEVPGAVAPSFDPPPTTEEAIATVAAGVGIVVVPMSLARLHHRKDAEHRTLTDGPSSTVALVWPADDPSALVDAFIGIVRGRTANSSRS